MRCATLSIRANASSSYEKQALTPTTEHARVGLIEHEDSEVPVLGLSSSILEAPWRSSNAHILPWTTSTPLRMRSSCNGITLLNAFTPLTLILHPRPSSPQPPDCPSHSHFQFRVQSHTAQSPLS